MAHTRTASLLLSCLFFSGMGLHAQSVYKWIDTEGKTHYGSQPPTDEKNNEALKLRSNSGFGGDNNVKGHGSEYNADGSKKISKEVQELAKTMEKALGTKDSKDAPLNCVTAVKSALDQADTALEVSAKNMKDGYITQADHDSNATKIRRAKAETTLGSCQFSTGKERKFYECMSNRNNHFSACVK